MDTKMQNGADAKLAEMARMAKAQAQRVIDKLPLLGPVTWLMMQQGPGRHAFVADLEWRIMPPLVLDQAKLYLRDGMPLAFVTWALLSEPVVARYRQAPHHLAPADWRSGEQPWIVDLFAPFGGAQDVLKDLHGTFPGKTIRQLGAMSNEQAEVIEWPAPR